MSFRKRQKEDVSMRRYAVMMSEVEKETTAFRHAAELLRLEVKSVRSEVNVFISDLSDFVEDMKDKHPA